MDLRRFELLLARARRLRDAGEGAPALEVMREALGFGAAQRLQTSPSSVDRNRSRPARGSASRGQCRAPGARARAGRRGQVEIPELKALVAQDPYRERIHALLMLALYRAGRQADALEAFRAARTTLVEELGLEPGPDLVRLEGRDSRARPSSRPAAASCFPAGACDGRQRASDGRGSDWRVAVSIIGREAELRTALELLERSDVRLVTLTGAGGVGRPAWPSSSPRDWGVALASSSWRRSLNRSG